MSDEDFDPSSNKWAVVLQVMPPVLIVLGIVVCTGIQCIRRFYHRPQQQDDGMTFTSEDTTTASSIMDEP